MTGRCRPGQRGRPAQAAAAVLALLPSLLLPVLLLLLLLPVGGFLLGFAPSIRTDVRRHRKIPVVEKATMIRQAGASARRRTTRLLCFRAPAGAGTLATTAAARRRAAAVRRPPFLPRGPAGRCFSTRTPAHCYQSPPPPSSSRLLSTLQEEEREISAQGIDGGLKVFEELEHQPAPDESVINGSGINGPSGASSMPPSSQHQHLNGEIPPTEEDMEVDGDALLPDGIRSRPRPGGNWDVENPLGWTREFGRRSAERDRELLESKKVKLGPGDEGYFDVSDVKIPMVTIVRTVEEAEIVVRRLMEAEPGEVYHACDTEVMDIDLSSVGPVGNGFVTCVSVYSGPDFDYGLGGPRGSVLWIDNLDDSYNVLQVFKDWFEDERHLKVWHNYGFDRHVMWNEGIDVRGFGGDTMHMARLQDTSRLRMAAGNGNGDGGATGYSLEALTHELIGRRKKPMKEIFGVRRLRKDGTEGLVVDLPPVEVMQRDPKFRTKWIEYSCYDAQGTWLIRNELEKRLRLMPWFMNKEDGTKYSLFDYYWSNLRPFGEVLTDMERRGIRVDARDYLAKVELKAREDRDRHAETFRQWAHSKIGPDGLALNIASSAQLATFLFGGCRNSKTKEETERVRVFKVPREEIPDDALEAYRSQKEKDEEAKRRKAHESDAKNDQIDYLGKMKLAQLKALCKECGLKVSGKKAELQERLKEYFLSAPSAEAEKAAGGDGEDDIESMSDEDLRDALIGRGLSSSGKRQDLIDRYRADIDFIRQVKSAHNDADGENSHALSEILEEAAKKGNGVLSEFLREYNEKKDEFPKFIDVTVSSIGLRPTTFTAGGAPSCTAPVLRDLAGDPFADPPRYGTAYEQVGEEGCKALFSLCAIGSIDTMISNFLTSLQELVDSDSRVHCSLNFNTETGRLSSRRPNLQNQPALEKDKYQIRKAFQASPGNNLIVADYGQLELRILASITNCKSMVDAFFSGGDFHSRTAIDMFPYVKEAVDNGDCLLEWDYNKGDPPKPLLKDKFASERRKAKTLNFSIAYGKTAHGLSKDWGVSQKEAEDMLTAWYEARPEVEKWQRDTKKYARSHGITRTLMGRYRMLPEAKMRDRRLLGHAERASINTPIQGGAADIAMMAMIKINDSEKLKRLGWVLLLQIHDEVILEGPEETAEEAFEEVLQCMEEPWVFGLDKMAVPLVVDGSCVHKNWFEAK